jgi:hypothetical protein
MPTLELVGLGSARHKTILHIVTRAPHASLCIAALLLLLSVLLPALSLLVRSLLWATAPPTTAPLVPPLVLPLLLPSLLLLWLLQRICTHQQDTGASHLLLCNHVKRWGWVTA